LALQEYARRRPGVAFVNGTSGRSSSILLRTSSASISTERVGCGLGDYAYRMLGWRTVVTVAEEADPLSSGPRPPGSTPSSARSAASS
jgi:hypothetical protein